MQLLLRLSLGPADGPTAIPGELFESLVTGLACDNDDLRDAIDVLRLQQLVICTAEEDDERISITATGGCRVRQWLARAAPLFGSWPPDNPAADDATG